MAKETPQETPRASEQDMKDAKNAGGDDTALKQQNLAASQEDGTVSTAPVDGVVVRRAGTTRREAGLPPLPTQNLTVVEQDVYEEFYLDGDENGRPLYRLRYARGQVVLTSEYEAVTNGDSRGFSRGGTLAENPGVGDVAQMVNGAESVSGATVEPQGPAKASAGRR